MPKPTPAPTNCASTNPARARRNAGEAVAEHAPECRSRVGERRGRREPVGRADVGRHHRRRRDRPARAGSPAAAGGGHAFGEPLARPGANLRGELQDVNRTWHAPSRRHQRAAQLRNDVGREQLPRAAPAAHAIASGDRRIEVGAADRARTPRSGRQPADRGQRVGEQRDRHVAARRAARP